MLRIAERVLREGDVRSATRGEDLRPEHARDLLRAWLEAIAFEGDEAALLAWLESDAFSHRGLHRTARRAHERKLLAAIAEASAIATDGGDLARAAHSLFDACLAVVPYAPATAFLASERAKLTAPSGEPPRVALVADGLGSMHGVTHTLEEIRERGVPGFEVEIIGTDPNVDRRLAAVADIEIPFYRGLSVGVPTLPAIVEALSEGRYDAVHLCSPGPAGVGAALVARMTGVPVVGSYHTELAAYAGLRSGDARLEQAMSAGLSLFYGSCDLVLSPSPASDESLRLLGVAPERTQRWERGVDISRFSPTRRVPGLFPGELNVLYAGRQSNEKGADLLVDAFLAARQRDPRLHLVLAGGGPEEAALRDRLGGPATFLGWLQGDELARAYASADAFLFASQTDTFGQVILEAQASGLPVVAVAEGGPAGLIEQRRTGILCPPTAQALASALTELAAAPDLRSALGSTAAAAVRSRTWERTLEQLADGYNRALSTDRRGIRRAA